MRARTRELIQYGESCGFVLEGHDGRDHYVMSHSNGERVRVSGSPGDYRGDDNTRATMRRLSGVTPERARSGKYRKGIGRRHGFSMRAAVEEKDDSLSGSFTTGGFHHDIPERTGGELLRLRAELLRLKAEYAHQPSNALLVKIRDAETRIRLEVY